MFVAVNKSLIDRVNNCERELVGSLARIRPTVGEDPANFSRRRAKEIAKLIHPNRAWGTRVAKRIVSWDSHIARDHARAWCGHLRSIQPSPQTLLRRTFQSAASVCAGKVLGRQGAGRPHTSFSEGVQYSKEVIEAADLRAQI